MTTPLWQPAGNIVTSITNANPGVVTTASNHGYFSGAIVQFFFPRQAGMSQLLGNTYIIAVTSPTTFSINANTIPFDAFVSVTVPQVPQVVPVGEIAGTLKNREANLLTPTPSI